MARPRKVDGIFWSPATGCWEWQPIIDGKRRHKQVRDPDQTDAGRKKLEARVRAYLDQLAAEKVEAAVEAATADLAPAKPTAAYTTHSWIWHWINDLKPNLSYNGRRNYLYSIEQDILPALDDGPLPECDSDAFTTMLARIALKGSTDKSRRAYETCRAIWNAAKARPKETGVTYNPLDAVDRPAHRSAEVRPFTVEEVRRFVAACNHHRAGRRWTIAVTRGVRPGEARAMLRENLYLVDRRGNRHVIPRDRSKIDFSKVRGALEVRKNLYRRKWLHGCDDPHACGARFHVYENCPGHGPKHARYHANGCGRPRRLCKPGCTEHAPQCKHRHGGISPDGKRLPGGLVRKDPKSEKGRRRFLLSREETLLLLDHLDAQDRERRAAGQRWIGSGALFATQWGGEMSERRDWEDFQEILVLAGLDRTRPYTSRHSAYVMRRLQKVDKSVAMAEMGWAVDMSHVYDHLFDEDLAKSADAVADLVWGTPGEGSATDPATGNVVSIKKVRRKGL